MSERNLNKERVITGNLTKDPELRYTPNGKAVCEIDVAENKIKDDKKSTNFWNKITLWESLALNVTESLHKGDRVMVVFYSQDNNWVDKDGNTRESEKHTATACGAELRWASATVTKNTKDIEHKSKDDDGEEEPF